MEPSRTRLTEGSGSGESRDFLRNAGLFNVQPSPRGSAAAADASAAPVSASATTEPLKPNLLESKSNSLSKTHAPTSNQRAPVEVDPATTALNFETDIKRYFFQLVVGCGDSACPNKFCKSCSSGPRLQETEAAVWATNLAAGVTTHFCTKIENNEIEVSDALSKVGIPASTLPDASMDDNSFSHHMTVSLLSPFSHKIPRRKPGSTVPEEPAAPKPLDVHEFLRLVEECENTNDFTPCIIYIQQAISSPVAMSKSFSKPPDLRLSATTKPDDLPMPAVDLDAVSLVYSTIMDREDLKLAFAAALETLFIELEVLTRKMSSDLKLLRAYVILFSSPLIGQTNLTNYSYLIKKFLKCFVLLHKPASQAILKMIFSWPVDRIQALIDTLHVCINNHVRSEAQHQQETLVLYACGVLSEISKVNDERNAVPFTALYNSFLNMKLNLKERFKSWKMFKDNGDNTKLDVFDFPIILDAIAKSRILHIESFLAMSGELEDAYVVALFRETFADIAKSNPKQVNYVIPPSHLILKVRREHLLEDTIEQIVNKVKWLRKPLKVSFEGEEGVDYSGVQKEFFQLLTEAIFDQELGLWKANEQQRFFWFSNKRSPEARRLFKFAGILLGLALYNGIILDVNFPLVLYKKLLNIKPRLADLSDFNPQMALGLQKLLAFEGDVESTYCYSFQTSVEKSDGTVIQIDLKPQGGDIPVTNQNRQEYVDLYVKWVFESSVQEQFDPFYRGFHLVCDGYAPKMCRPEELEQLICGSRVLNFDELKEETEYVGFTESSPQIRWFWQIALSMNEDEKKKLMQFVTGSDRAPIEGLRSQPFRIQRNGPDSDRLPTSHTCFSVLMLPEYSSKDKLKRQLTTAIQNSQGFGLM